MKKRVGLITGLVLVTVLAGCGNGNTGISSEPTANLKLPTPEPAAEIETDMSSAKGSAGQVDVDLSEMSSTMIYSEVYNMMSVPDEYVGKTVKMNGTCATYHDEQTGKDYYACIVKDATACCSQGIEFELKQPNYPKPDDEITVVGTFQTYIEGENRYCVLKDATVNM